MMLDLNRSLVSGFQLLVKISHWQRIFLKLLIAYKNVYKALKFFILDKDSEGDGDQPTIQAE